VRLGDPAAFEEIDLMDGRTFEHLVADLFGRLGYEIERTEFFDRGADLIIIRDEKRTAVQVKRAKNLVRQEAVQAVVTSKAVYACERAMVVTNSSFNGRAKQLARANDVELWARPELMRALLSFCALCEKAVSDPVHQWCMDRSEEYGGRVYCFEHQRSFAGILRTA
jgi:restriction system protein